MAAQQENLPEIVRYIQALGLPMLTLVASFIAYMQWRTADQKVQVDLFDKRMKICLDLQSFLKPLDLIERFYAEDVRKFDELDIKIKFLFNNKIYELYSDTNFQLRQYSKIFESIPEYPPPRGFLLLEPANVTLRNQILDLIEEMHFYSRIDRSRPAFMSRNTIKYLQKNGSAAGNLTIFAIGKFFEMSFPYILKAFLIFCVMLEVIIKQSRKFFGLPPLPTPVLDSVKREKGSWVFASETSLADVPTQGSGTPMASQQCDGKLYDNHTAVKPDNLS